MKTIYLAMADIETVDRAFSKREDAVAYVKGWLKEHVYYKENPDKFPTDDEIVRYEIRECPFDSFEPKY